MNTTVQAKRKILYDFIEPGAVPADIADDPRFSGKIDRIKRERISSVFIITPRVADSYAYLRLVKELEHQGIVVRGIYINELSEDIFHYIDRAVDDITGRFKKGNCMIISYGSRHAAALIAGVFVSAGKDVDEAVSRVERISPTLTVTDGDRKFLQLYRRYIFGASLPAVETPPARVKEDSIRAQNPAETSLHTVREITKPRVMPAPEPPQGENRADDSVRKPDKITAVSPPPPEKVVSAGKRKFYTSLRFKLISIISAVIVISLSGMIFLATYYFKSDNRIRIQQSNLDIAKIMALKVRSDFLTLIDNSKAITQDYLARRGGRGMDLLASTDRSFAFFGIAVGTKGEELQFTGKEYNQDLLDEIQTSRETVDSVNGLRGKSFARSFNGEIVIENISEVFRFPVMGISYPLRLKGRDAIDSVVVNHVRLDRILTAFRAEDRIGQVFMVNGRGQVIAHQDGEQVLNARDYINLPIVAAMIKSPQNNGQIRYRDENGVYHLGSFWKIGVGDCGVISTVEEDKALQQVYDMQRRNFYLMVIVLTVVIMIVFFFGSSITSPIVRLVEATRRIKDGEYRVNISSSSRDEIGDLTNAFVEMGIGLEEREKMKVAFGKFVNKEVAEQVLRGELRLGGERKEAAILFSDIRSFTAISERLEPEEVVEFLNEYMTRMVNCINNTNGVVDKFIGDAIMAIWGAPVSHGNDIENAINAALMMRHELMIFNQSRGGDRKPHIKIGCGINAGPVLAGQIGSEDRMEYTVIGDAVNLASRIESLTKPFGVDILISQDAYERIKDIFLAVPMQKIKVKGKSESQQIYAVLGRINNPDTPENIESLRKILGIDMTGIPTEDVGEEVKYEIIDS